MLRLTRTAIGLLTAQYRSVLRKCWAINVGIFGLMGKAAASVANGAADTIGGTLNGYGINVIAYMLGLLDSLLNIKSNAFDEQSAKATATMLPFGAPTVAGTLSAFGANVMDSILLNLQGKKFVTLKALPAAVVAATVMATTLTATPTEAEAATGCSALTASSSLVDVINCLKNDKLAVGYSNTASGNYSSAVGYINTASGENWSSAVGAWNTASGDSSSAFGAYNTASGNYSSAVGYQSNAAQDYTTAIGYEAVANVAGTTTQGIISVGHKNGDPVGRKNRFYTSDYFSRIINVAEGTDGSHDAVTMSQLGNIAAGTKILNATGTSAKTFGTGSGQTTVGAAIATVANELVNNYYRKEDLGSRQVIDFTRYFKSGKFGENARFLGVINDNFATNLTSKIGGFATNHPPRLGAFAKCEKACSRLSERFPTSLEKNSAFEQYSRSARGTFLFVSQTRKNVMDNLSKCRAANDNSSIINNNSNDKTGVFGAPVVAGTTLNGRRRFNVMIADFLQNAQFMAVANDNFAIVTTSKVA